MMTFTELQLLKGVLAEAQSSDVGAHWLPGQYASELQQCIRAVDRELKEFEPKVKVTFSVYCGARSSYLDRDSTKLSATWYDVEHRKKHPSLTAARAWVPKARRDPEWEMAIHEFHDDELVAKHKI